MNNIQERFDLALNAFDEHVFNMLIKSELAIEQIYGISVTPELPSLIVGHVRIAVSNNWHIVQILLSGDTIHITVADVGKTCITDPETIIEIKNAIEEYDAALEEL